MDSWVSARKWYIRRREVREKNIFFWEKTGIQKGRKGSFHPSIKAKSSGALNTFCFP